MELKLNKKYFDTPAEILDAVDKAVLETDVVLDIGCGIVPMSYFRPKLHLMMEPWKEYSDILGFRHAGDKSVIIFRQFALEGLKAFADQSVDSIFMLDVIEHMPKDVGFAVLAECNRVARRQIVIFTTLGFMPQHVNLNQEKDGWGLNGAEVQEHLSGWTPEDFPSSYDFFICKQFHTMDFREKKLAEPFGAFYAICNIQERTIDQPKLFSDFRRPLQIEIDYQNIQSYYQDLQDDHQKLQSDYQKLTASYNTLKSLHQSLVNTKAVRLSNRLKKLIGKPTVE